jgi:hypothetical protein
VGFHLSKLNARNEICSAFMTTDYITDMTDVAKLIVKLCWELLSDCPVYFTGCVYGVMHLFFILFYEIRVIMFNATFNNISVISWWSDLLVEESGENHRHVAKGICDGVKIIFGYTKNKKGKKRVLVGVFFKITTKRSLIKVFFF